MAEGCFSPSFAAPNKECFPWPLPEAGIDGVEVHPNFWFVATGNPVGSGYHTASLDRALEDRFQAIYEIKEPLAPERDVLSDLVGGTVADGLDRFATDARRNEATYVSTRNLIQAARLVQRGTHPVEAVTLAISRKFRGYQDGLDELALHGESMIYDLEHGDIRKLTVTAQDFGLPHYPLSAIEGGEPEENRQFVESALNGEGKEAHRAAIAMNCGALLKVTGKVTTFKVE